MHRSAVLLAPLALAASVAVAGPAAAQHGDPGVRASGHCSGSAEWRLTARHDDRRIEVEFEIDSDRAGQRWSWRLTDEGARVARGSATTAGRSGSFSIERHVGDRTGTDSIRLVATRGGQTCTGAVRV